MNIKIKNKYIYNYTPPRNHFWQETMATEGEVAQTATKVHMDFRRPHLGEANL